MMCCSYTDLRKAVPDEHKKFLTDLVWVHEEVNLDLFFKELTEIASVQVMYEKFRS